MKIRSGFVSNSSSASFVLDKRYISAKQAHEVINFKGVTEGWHITEDENFIRGHTSMDNDELFEIVKNFGNDRIIVTWDRD